MNGDDEYLRNWAETRRLETDQSDGEKETMTFLEAMKAYDGGFSVRNIKWKADHYISKNGNYIVCPYINLSEMDEEWELYTIKMAIGSASIKDAKDYIKTAHEGLITASENLRAALQRLDNV